MTKLAVISYRPAMIYTAGEWNFIHSRNLALMRMGVDLKMFCGLPEECSVPDHLLNAEYPLEIFRSSLKLNNLLLFSYYGIEAKIPDEIIKKIIEFSPNAVLATGYNCLPDVIRKINNRIRIVMDVHATAKELVDYGTDRERFFAYPRRRLFERKWHPKINAALVVSDYLGEEVKESSSNKNIKIFKAPCAAVYKPTWSEVIKNRNEYRKMLKIAPDEILLAHSGGLGLYQHPTPMIKLLQSLLDKNIPARLLFATGHSEKAREAMKDFPASTTERIIARNFPNNEHLKVLAASDVGLLLREDNQTNRVAFPNKADEYWSVGMPVATTAGLAAVSDMIKEDNAPGLILKNCEGKISEEECGWFANRGRLSESEREELFRRISKTREKISFETTLRPFIDYLKEGKG